MRIVAFGDVHQRPEQCGKIPGLDACDYLLVNGDLTNFGGRGAAARVIAALRQFCPRVFAQTGNLDRRSASEFLAQEGIDLHGQARLLVKGGDSLMVIGLGGSNPTPFFTPNELSELALARLLDQAWRQARALATDGANLPTLLLTHAPPHGTQLDRLKNGRHVGSKAVRAFIEQYQPSLCVCGHIHEAKGEDRLGATILFNPGAFAQGGWVEIDAEAGSVRAKLF